MAQDAYHHHFAKLSQVNTPKGSQLQYFTSDEVPASITSRRLYMKDASGNYYEVSGTGLTSVSHDATLTGDGTPGSPLSVVNIGLLPYGVAAGTDTYIVTVAPDPGLPFTTGQAFEIRFTNGNTGDSTIAINGSSAISIRDLQGNLLQAGDIQPDTTYLLSYDGTNLQLLGLGAEIINATHAQLAALKTGGTLVRGAWYFDTDDSVFLFALENNKFSLQAFLKNNVGGTDYFDIIKYNFDGGSLSARILSREDRLNNYVEGASISNFLFNGSNTDNKVYSQGVVNISSITGTFIRNEVANLGTITATSAAGSVLGNIVKQNSSITVTTQGGTGSTQLNEVTGSSSINAASNQKTILRNRVSLLSTITATTNDGVIRHNIVEINATLSAGSQASTGVTEYNRISQQATINVTSNSGSVVRNNVSGSGSAITATNNAGTIAQNTVLSGTITATSQQASGVTSFNFIFSNLGNIVVTANQGSVIRNAIFGLGGIAAASNTGSVEDNFISDSANGIDVTNNTGTVKFNHLSSDSYATLTDNTGTVQGNHFSTGASIAGTENAGSIQYNVLSAKDAIDSISAISQAATGVIDKNEIGTKSYITGTSNAGTITGNTLKGSSSILAASQVSTGSITDNTIGEQSQLTCTTNAGTFSNNRLGVKAAITANLDNGVTVTDCVFDISSAIISITLDPAKSETGKRITSGYSNFERTLDMDDPAIYDAGTDTLTIPAAYNYAGKFILDGAAGPYDIENIVNLPSNHPVTITPANSVVVNIINTAIAGIGATQIALEAAGPLALSGRTNGSDYIVLEKEGAFQRQVDASVLV